MGFAHVILLRVCMFARTFTRAHFLHTHILRVRILHVRIFCERTKKHDAIAQRKKTASVASPIAIRIAGLTPRVHLQWEMHLNLGPVETFPD